MSEVFEGVEETQTVEAKPAKAKKAKASTNGKPKKVSALDAAYKVLKGRSKPMNCKDLIEEMAKRKLWKSPSGATPHATLAAGLITEIAKKGKDSRFKKVAPGEFAAK